MSTPFPTPDEVEAHHINEIEPIVVLLREAIRNVLLTKVPQNGSSYWVVDPVAAVMKDIRPVPEYFNVKLAIGVIRDELSESGWHTNYEEYERGGQALYIWSQEDKWRR